MSVAADPFRAYSAEDWRQAATVALRGASLDKLVSKTSDGIAVGPIQAPTQGPRLTRAGGPWKVLARVDAPDAGEASESAIEDIAGAADGLQIVFAGAAGAYGYGLARHDATTQRAFETLRFDDGLKVELDLGPEMLAEAEAFAALVALRSAGHQSADVAFGLDPLGLRLRSGNAEAPWPEEARSFADLAGKLAADGHAGPFFAADGRAVHAAGGTPAQELAFTLACAIDYWRALEARGLAPEAARAAIGFRLAADADQFVTLAKFRAMRLLFASVEAAVGLAPRPIRLHAESAWRMMSARSPFTNVMRAALAAFAAGVGGADSVALLPFNRALGLPDGFARRLARNTQLIELRESHLGFVDDPAAGAGAFEALTAALSEKAWALFQDFERAGGVAAMLTTGRFQSAIGEAASALQRDVARLKAPLTGVSAHAELWEAKVEARAYPQSAPAYRGESFAPPLPELRLAEPFERLRDAADQLEARPKIYLAAIGAPSANSGRVGFARDLFEAGGFAVEADQIGDDAESAADKFRASGARFTCLCGADAAYATHAEVFARALKAAGASYLMLAGRPGDRETRFREAGVDAFLQAGMDAPEFLSQLLRREGATL